MIYNYPYFGFPNYLNYFSQNPYATKKETQNFQSQVSPYSSNTRYNNYEKLNTSQFYKNSYIPKNYNFQNNFKNNFHTNDNSKFKDHSVKKSNVSNAPIFNILGISLYFDDILLICVIFFLYNEEIEDSYLLLALVLLLLT